MKGKQNEGFSLMEVLVAMAILATIVIPVCSSMLFFTRINNKAEAVMQARLAVSSALETMMAQGFDEGKIEDYEDAFDVVIRVDKETDTYYKVTVSDAGDTPLVSITTYVRLTKTPENRQMGGYGQ